VRVGAVLVDFDGTVCPTDVSEQLLDAFGEPGWRAYDRAVDRGEMGLRQAAERQASMLHRGSADGWLAFALDRFGLDPTFPGFVAWAAGAGVHLQVVSDGFGFYVRPMLAAAGLGHLDVRTNDLDVSGPRPRLRHPFAHPECRGCGTCKMRADLEQRRRRGPVAFVGEGQSDRYGALYADVVFAKDHLLEICRRDGVPCIEWETFDDVRRTLEGPDGPPGAVAPPTCPGWRG
jgi:2-hydroxy-3-keto-5-methylthiopentenyl-1-phosphate phosphatase